MASFTNTKQLRKMTSKHRTATLEDIPQLCGLLDLLFSQEREFTPDRSLQVQGLTKIISDPEKGSILVAEHNDQVIGMINLQYNISTALGSCVGIVEDFVVEEAWRNKGIGKQLFEYMQQFAMQKGCGRLTLLTDFDNKVAIKFYNSQGFETSTMLPLRMSL